MGSLSCVVFFEGYGDHRDLHRVDRRQRQMCIRDRFADQAGEVFKILMEDCDVHTVLRCPNGTFSPYTAVSYTHLRAHETVLDLVCRLLLEKKKLYLRDKL